MDSRGYGRRIHQSESKRRVTNILMLLGLLGILFGLAGLLGVFSQSNIGALTLMIGISISFLALWFAGKNASRTNYRPDKWHIPEVLVITSAVFGLVAMRFTETIVLNPVTSPLTFPQVNFITLFSIWAAILAIPFSPQPPLSNRPVSDLFKVNTHLERNAA
jgi:energy-coupling factor transport system permease protein